MIILDLLDINVINDKLREEKKKLKIDYPPEHIIDKQVVLKNLEKHKSDSYVMWLDHASFIIKLGNTTIITDPVFEKYYGYFSPLCIKFLSIHFLAIIIGYYKFNQTY